MMFENIEFDNKQLIINNKAVIFSYVVKDALKIKSNVLVLLDIPMGDDTINNLYLVDRNGSIIWRSQDLREIYPSEVLLPYEMISISHNEIRAVDFYGRCYIINPMDGKIINRYVSR